MPTRRRTSSTERKHHAQNGGAFSKGTLDELDDRSSVAFLQPDDWAENTRPPPELLAKLRRRASDVAGGELPVSAPGTWLAQRGWRVRGGGPISLHELPRFLRDPPARPTMALAAGRAVAMMGTRA